MAVRRGVAVAMVAAGACGLVAAGWWAAYEFRSPEQRAAQAAPPDQGPIYARVRVAELVDRVSGSGTVQFARTLAVSPTAYPGNAVVTRAVAAAGATIAPCAPVTEVNGQPVFALAGRFRFYRDLGPGTRGTDVTQLRRALDRCGLLPASAGASDRFDSATRTAVGDLYARAGYPRQSSLPLTGSVVVAALPARLVTGPAVGALPADDTPLVRLGTGSVDVQVSLAAAAAARLPSGAAASLTLDGAAPAAATVAGIGDGSDADGLVPVRLRPTRPLPASALGRRAVATITVRAVAGRATAVVPGRALVLSEGTDRGRVRVRAGRTAARTVQVRVLGSLQGEYAVVPLDGASLRSGDLVQVR